MENISIYEGTSSFTPGSTPFGFYDADPIFQIDADKLVKWSASRLGWPMVAVELNSGSFYAAFEEAVTTYGNEVYQWKIRENYYSLEGTPTGSIINDKVITPSLGSLLRLAKTYGTEAGSGGNVNYYSGSIIMYKGQQTYDLNQWAVASASLTPGDSIEIKKVFHQSPPAIVRYFDPYAGTGTGIQSLLETFNFGSYSPGINFMLMPIYFDIQKVQAIKLNDEIRKSNYSFELINNKIKIFPIPVRTSLLRFEYIKVSERDSSFNNNMGSGLITDISKVPYSNPIYANINSTGRQWIFQYTLSIVKEMLAYVRGKYNTIPIPGSDVALNQSDLLTDARREKETLLEALRKLLEDSSRDKQLEKKEKEEGYLKSTLNNIPLAIYIG